MHSNCTSAISGYLMRLPRSLWLLAMTIRCPRSNAPAGMTLKYKYSQLAFFYVIKNCYSHINRIYA
ncbi:hypothetical protein [Rickettsia felis]|uniref:hypothetical protein n=1 Tax=Rickettsia felis TaxID=42862 RepID=UPI0015848981|nr:hypothetical protein [Rickettsia felis]